MEPLAGLGPAPAALRKQCAALTLQRQGQPALHNYSTKASLRCCTGAGEGTRTPNRWVEARSDAISLRLRVGATDENRTRQDFVGNDVTHLGSVAFRKGGGRKPRQAIRAAVTGLGRRVTRACAARTSVVE